MDRKLLKTPIDDRRHLCLWHILVPYLVNVKQVLGPETHTIVEEWLRECDKKRKVLFDIRYEIKYIMKNIKDFPSISSNDLKEKHPELYDMIED